jgi:O-succinylbenzoate synthase
MPSRRLPFSVPLRHPVLGVTQRSGWLIEGQSGWAEWSPLPSWSREEILAAYRGAMEAAENPFPRAGAESVAVNAMIPRVNPEVAAALTREARAAGCATIKVKVGDGEAEPRLRAVRLAAGESTRIRLDANGTWTLEEAERALLRFSAYSIELAEDPVATLEEMARLRPRVPVPLAAEMPIRVPDDVLQVRRLGAADAILVKPQRIGGMRAALRAAELAQDLPVIVSSALETSVGLAMCAAVAAAVPAHGFAHGIGTALLLAEDVTTRPLRPEAGRVRATRVTPDLLLARHGDLRGAVPQFPAPHPASP